MNALEEARIENVLELFHGAAQDVRLTARVNTHVVAGGVDPLDRCDGNAHDLAALTDRQNFGMRRLHGGTAALQELLERDFAAAADFSDESDQPIALFRGVTCTQMRAHF